MKPIIILPPKTMSEEHIKLLRDNDLCVVVATDPAKVKFVDPIPASSSRTQIENAAIKFSRMLLNGRWGEYSNANQIGVSEFSKIYISLLMDGTALDWRGTTEEQQQRIFDDEKLAEIRKLAREEAKAERAAVKAKAKETAKT